MINIIKRNFLSFFTISSGIVAIALQRFDKLNPETSQGIMFGLICLLATTELFEKSKKLNDIHEAVKFTSSKNKELKDSISQEIADATSLIVSAVKTPYLSEKFERSTDALEYIINKVKHSKKQVLHASVSPSFSTKRTEYRSKFTSAVKSALQFKDIQYKYVTILSREGKVEELKEMLNNEKYPKYFVGIYRDYQKKLPSIYFLVIDREEVIARYPNEFGDDDEYVKIHDPLVIEVFSKYHKKLWSSSMQISAEDDLSKINY